MLRLLRAVAFAIRFRQKQQKIPGEATSSTPPYGFRVRRRRGRRFFVIDPCELRVMRRCHELYADGLTYDKIRQFFRVAGVRSRKGGELCNGQLLEMNRKFTAMLRAGKLPPEFLPRADRTNKTNETADSAPGDGV